MAGQEQPSDPVRTQRLRGLWGCQGGQGEVTHFGTASHYGRCQAGGSRLPVPTRQVLSVPRLTPHLRRESRGVEWRLAPAPPSGCGEGKGREKPRGPVWGWAGRDPGGPVWGRVGKSPGGSGWGGVRRSSGPGWGSAGGSAGGGRGGGRVTWAWVAAAEGYLHSDNPSRPSPLAVAAAGTTRSSHPRPQPVPSAGVRDSGAESGGRVRAGERRRRWAEGEARQGGTIWGDPGRLRCGVILASERPRTEAEESGGRAGRHPSDGSAPAPLLPPWGEHRRQSRFTARPCPAPLPRGARPQPWPRYCPFASRSTSRWAQGGSRKGTGLGSPSSASPRLQETGGGRGLGGPGERWGRGKGARPRGGISSVPSFFPAERGRRPAARRGKACGAEPAPGADSELPLLLIRPSVRPSFHPRSSVPAACRATAICAESLVAWGTSRSGEGAAPRWSRAARPGHRGRSLASAWVDAAVLQADCGFSLPPKRPSTSGSRRFLGTSFCAAVRKLVRWGARNHLDLEAAQPLSLLPNKTILKKSSPRMTWFCS